MERYSGTASQTSLIDLEKRIIELEKLLAAQVLNSADLMLMISGSPTDGQIFTGTIDRDLTWPDDGAGSVAACLTAPTAQVDIDIQQNGTSIGTVSFAASQTLATFSGTETAFQAGDTIEFHFPATADATIADIGITLLMLRGDDPAAVNGAVKSVFSRTGAVVAVAGDYNSTLITNASATVPGATVTAALDSLASESQTFPVYDYAATIAAGTNKWLWVAPYDVTLLGVQADLGTAQTSGALLTVDINDDGASVLTIPITIDNTELSSATAVTPAVVGSADILAGSRITIDVDQIGDGTAKGLFVRLLMRPA